MDQVQCLDLTIKGINSDCIEREKMTVKIEPGQYVHITNRDLGQIVTLKKSEDYAPSGVSFSPSIKQCLEGIPCFYIGKDKRASNEEWKNRMTYLKKNRIWYVYTPIKTEFGVIPRVDDLHRTAEVRVLKHVEARLLTIVKVYANKKWTVKDIGESK